MTPRDDEGSIAPFIPVVILVLLMLGGLLIDGSRDLQARGDAQGYAEEAARAGASAVDLTQDTLTLDKGLAKQRVDDYCAKAMSENATITQCAFDGITADSTCDANGNLVNSDIVVHVVVETQINATLLGMVGIRNLSAGGSAQARPYQGTTVADAC